MLDNFKKFNKKQKEKSFWEFHKPYNRINYFFNNGIFE